MTLSLGKHFSLMLRSQGYDILWKASGRKQTHTEGDSKGTITLVPSFPANPTFIKRHTVGSPASHEVTIPAFSLRVLGSPRKIQRAGIGDPTFERERSFRIDGLARDSFEHRAFNDMLYDWLQGTDVYLDIWNYDVSRTEPPPLERAWVSTARVSEEELTTGDEAHRYYVSCVAALRYFE
jgi:hypothetical protein